MKAKEVGGKIKGKLKFKDENFFKYIPLLRRKEENIHSEEEYGFWTDIYNRTLIYTE